jgi:hypothetical protein
MVPACRAVGRALGCWILAVAAVAGVSSCARAPVACAGQCAPPYELMVDFRADIPPAEATMVLKSCADNNPVVVRIGVLQHLSAGFSRALIYTHVFGQTKQTDGLLSCLRASGATQEVGWPD